MHNSCTTCRFIIAGALCNLAKLPLAGREREKESDTNALSGGGEMAQKARRRPPSHFFQSHTPTFIHRRLLVHIKHVYPHGRQPKAPAGAIIFNPPPHLLLLALMSSLILRAQHFIHAYPSFSRRRRWRERKSALLRIYRPPVFSQRSQPRNVIYLAVLRPARFRSSFALV